MDDDYDDDDNNNGDDEDVEMREKKTKPLVWLNGWMQWSYNKNFKWHK